MSFGTAMLAAATGAAALAGLRWAIWRGFRVDRPPVTATPADFGLDYAEASIATANGKHLAGWLIPSGPRAPVLAVMHGWGANAEAMLPLAVALHRHGYAMLLVDARSHGRSDGDSFSSMPRFAEDIDAALDWLAARPDIDPARIAVLGHSVGGAAALLCASRRHDIAAVVSLAAFDHPERVMRAYLARARIPFRPFGWLVCRYVEHVIGHRFDAIAPVATVARIRCPVLIGHGTDDRLVAPAAAHAIHAATGGRAELALLDGTGHEAPICYDSVAAVLADFLGRALSA